jgi:predicted HTH transcriptional regulator
VAQKTKDAALAAYRERAPDPDDEMVARMIEQGESSRLEFKSTARWDVKEGKKNSLMEEVILKTVAGFLNSRGGTLLIGVADDGTVLGLDADYSTFGERPDADGFEQWLTHYLGNKIGHGLDPFTHVSFHKVKGKQICRVRIDPAPRPVRVNVNKKEQFFIRANNTTSPLSPTDEAEYLQHRWR